MKSLSEIKKLQIKGIRIKTGACWFPIGAKRSASFINKFFAKKYKNALHFVEREAKWIKSVRLVPRRCILYPDKLP
jgi:hypothetical protein